MTVIRIDDLSDSRLDPYRQLRTTNLTRYSGLFIAESKPLVRRLIESPLSVQSILVEESFLDEAMTWLPTDCEIYTVQSDDIDKLVGFQFHRGYLACGIRPSKCTFNIAMQESSWTGVLLVGVQDPENMGSIFRTCSALGIADIILGPDCVDPFARRVLRVSMGNAFKLSLHECLNPVSLLNQISDVGIQSLAACLDEQSIELRQFGRSGPSLVVFGNEAHGLPPGIIQATRHRLKIDMNLGTDSLNVSVAAGIILHYVCRLAYSK